MAGMSSHRKVSCHNASMSAEMEDGFTRFSVKGTLLGISLLVSIFALLGGAKSGRTSAVDFGVMVLTVTARIIESYNRQGRNASTRNTLKNELKFFLILFLSRKRMRKKKRPCSKSKPPSLRPRTQITAFRPCRL